MTLSASIRRRVHAGGLGYASYREADRARSIMWFVASSRHSSTHLIMASLLKAVCSFSRALTKRSSRSSNCIGAPVSDIACFSRPNDESKTLVNARCSPLTRRRDEARNEDRVRR